MEPMKLQSAKVLSASEEKSIDQRIEQLKEIVNEKEVVQGVNFESKDPQAIDAKIAELERVKREQGVPALSPKERDRVQSEIKMLEEDLRRDMPTWHTYQSSTPKDGASHSMLVQKIVKWDKDPIRRQKVQRWKTLRRMLEPNDPQYSSVMYLFPQ